MTPPPAPVLPNVATPTTARIVTVCLKFLEVTYMHMPASDLFSWSCSCRSCVHGCAGIASNGHGSTTAEKMVQCLGWGSI